MLEWKLDLVEPNVFPPFYGSVYGMELPQTKIGATLAASRSSRLSHKSQWYPTWHSPGYNFANKSSK